MSGPHADYALAMWRKVLASGTAGVEPALLTAQARATGRSRRAVEQCLQGMRESDFLRFVGKTKYGRWHVGSRVPPKAVPDHELVDVQAQLLFLIEQARTVAAPKPAPRKQYRKPLAELAGGGRGAAPTGRPMGVPNSIFQLGSMLQNGGTTSCA